MPTTRQVRLAVTSSDMPAIVADDVTPGNPARIATAAATAFG
jgi:hypothetical protein